MRLPAFTRIVFEDLPREIQSWVGKLIDPINNFMLTVRNGLNKGITITENMAGDIKTLTMSGNAISFSYENYPKAVILGSWQDKTSSAWAPTSGITLKWSYDNEVISCAFYGTDTSHTYNITLVIFNN